MRKILYVLSIISLLLVIFVYSLPKGSDSVIYISEMYIYDGGVEYEVYIDTNKQTWLRVDDEVTLLTGYPRSALSRLDITLYEGIEENILDSSEVYFECCYDVPYTYGLYYVSYLVNEGYNIECCISTSEYSEFYLSGSSLKRVILMENTLMVTDMLEGEGTPDIFEYLDKYNYNNVIDKIKEGQL